MGTRGAAPESASGQRSIFWRAVLALGLMVGFYLLALGMAGALLSLPYLEAVYGNRIHLKLALFCLVGAFLILKAVVPRPDRFEAPGPLLDAKKHPRLFMEIRQVAVATGQSMPREVYLVPDVNAWVAQRGGIMGFGSRRVMGLGLPLLSMLRAPELRAVLAHEFGHYYGGDVKLGPWIYKTRQALLRTVESLGEHSGILKKPFLWYGKLFFRVTHAVSRRQELQADALAASIAGPAALARGLVAVHRGGIAFGPYWSSEVSPVLNAGFLPPLARGFDLFLNHPRVAVRIEEALAAAAKEDARDPYDTHPSLPERLRALGNPSTQPTGEGVYAITLLDDVKGLESALLARVAGPEDVRGLKPVAWDDVGAAVYVPMWERYHAKYGQALSGITPPQLASTDWRVLGKKVADRLEAQDSSDARGHADAAVGMALALALVRRGFVVDTAPGGVVTLVKGTERLEPFSVRAHLESGALRSVDWPDRCSRLGIATLDLARAGDPAAA
jgi:Zn-dependent protease with chaperone function